MISDDVFNFEVKRSQHVLAVVEKKSELAFIEKKSGYGATTIQ